MTHIQKHIQKQNAVCVNKQSHTLPYWREITNSSETVLYNDMTKKQSDISPAGEFIFFSTLGNPGDIQLSHHYKKHNN